jgi:hypothetical protein
MNLQDYLMSDDDKAKLVENLTRDIAFDDETFESDIVDSNSNECDDEEGLI